jgi:hypothetical protein
MQTGLYPESFWKSFNPPSPGSNTDPGVKSLILQIPLYISSFSFTRSNKMSPLLVVFIFQIVVKFIDLIGAHNLNEIVRRHLFAALACTKLTSIDMDSIQQASHNADGWRRATRNTTTERDPPPEARTQLGQRAGRLCTMGETAAAT